eukprot:5620617-Prymnesium_polylepis.2
MDGERAQVRRTASQDAERGAKVDVSHDLREVEVPQPAAALAEHPHIGGAHTARCHSVGDVQAKQRREGARKPRQQLCRPLDICAVAAHGMGGTVAALEHREARQLDLQERRQHQRRNALDVEPRQVAPVGEHEREEERLHHFLRA